LWDAATGEEAGSLPGHSSTVETLAFSPDGKVLVSGSCDTTILFWDPWTKVAKRKPPSDRLSKDRLADYWRDLKDEDAKRAHQAICTLAQYPSDAVPYLSQSLTLGRAPDDQVITRLIGGLDDDDFDKRERASAELGRLGRAAGVGLRRALDGKPSPEARQRLTELLRRIEELYGADRIRMIRAIETLERIGTPDAQEVLERLRTSGDWPGAEEADAALERLSRRPSPWGELRK
jgi:hypothetical protein